MARRFAASRPDEVVWQMRDFTGAEVALVLLLLAAALALAGFLGAPLLGGIVVVVVVVLAVLWSWWLSQLRVVISEQRVLSVGLLRVWECPLTSVRRVLCRDGALDIVLADGGVLRHRALFNVLGRRARYTERQRIMAAQIAARAGALNTRVVVVGDETGVA